jgi:DNA-binding transcriptional LysR family regulator
VQNKLEMMRIFKAAAESLNFKEAAVRLGVSPQSVTRAIKDLEEILGEPLFYRSTRNTSITDFGKQIAHKNEEIIDQIDTLLRPHKSNDVQKVEGLVRITMSSVLGRRYLLPALTDFLKDYPDVQLDLRFSDLIDNVVAEQMDIGVRIGFFDNNRKVARRVNEVKFHIVGTPELIAKTGMPTKVSDLNQMPFTGLVDHNTGRMWPWSFANISENFHSSAAFLTDDPEAELTAVLAGIGYGQMGDFLCDEFIQSGQLVPVLQNEAPAPWGIYVYRPQRGPVAERVRLVFDYLVKILNEANFYRK